MGYSKMWCSFREPIFADILNFSLDVLPTNLWTFQFIKAETEGRGVREYRRYQILLLISHPMTCLRTSEPFNSPRLCRGQRGSGISQISNFIANISPDVLSSNLWTFQFLKAVQRAGESGISPISNIIANISPDVSPSNTWTFQFTKTVQIIWERCLLLQ